MQKTILSTADVARLFGVTETTVKRWADEGTLKCQKTPGGHRKFDVRHLVEFANEHGFEPAGVLTMPPGDKLGPSIQVGVLTRNFADLRTAFVEKALSPDKTDLHQLLSFLYEHKISLADIYDNVVGPGMAEIGERWVRGEIGVNHEHRASHETLDALARLQAEILVRPANGLSVVCACPADEQHEIGLRCVAYLFESEGWNVHYLGGRTPVESILAAAGEANSQLVCMSVSAAQDESDIRSILTRVYAFTRRHGMGLVVGGTGARHEFVGQNLCDAVAKSARELLEYMETVSPTRAHAVHARHD